jgi:tetratricopeptide (TPR) repeat protein
MKTQIFFLRTATIALLLFAFIFGQSLQAQNDNPTIYLEVTHLKKTGDDLMSMDAQLIKPFVQERIKQDNQLAHYLFKVVYPYADKAEYDFVVIDIYKDFNDLHISEKKVEEIAHAAFPNANIPKMIERYKKAAENVGSEVFVIRDEAFPGPKGASDKEAKFVTVNHMKVSEANGDAYTKMESEIFKPLHQARAKAGNMHEWVLAQRIMPYGTLGDNTFLTFDIYNEWGDMGVGMSDGLFKKVHPDKDPNTVWNKMANLRELRRSEVWEMVAKVTEPAPEVTYKTVREGTGPSPLKGQEVSFKFKLSDMDGETLVSSDELGIEQFSIVGENYYDRYFDKGIMQMKKGGSMTITIPPAGQDKWISSNTNGGPAIVKIELVDIFMPKPNGAKLLGDKIRNDGLNAGKEFYKKLQTNNPEGYVFREGDMNQLGYALISEDKTDAAIYVFELNTKNYPKSWNACDSLADGYRSAGNIAKAKHCYEMALKINPDFKASRDKLAQL